MFPFGPPFRATMRNVFAADIPFTGGSVARSVARSVAQRRATLVPRSRRNVRRNVFAAGIPFVARFRRNTLVATSFTGAQGIVLDKI